MGHEVGHALYTPLDGILKEKTLKLNRGICNVIDDVRIERKIKVKYPGLRNSFLKAYKELYENDFFGVKGANLQELNFIDRLNLYEKIGTHLGIKFTPFERDLVDRVEKTESYDDVLEMARIISDYMNEKQKELDEKVKNELAGDEEAESEDEFEYDDMDMDDVDSEYQDDPLEKGSKRPNSKIKNFDMNSDNDLTEEVSAKDDSDDEINKVKSLTDEAYYRNQLQMFDRNKIPYNYVNIPKLDLNEIIMDFKDFLKEINVGSNDLYYDKYDPKEFLRIRKDNDKAVSYLAKEFEMRKNAEQMKRSSIAKTGELNMSKIYSYKFSEDIFKRMTIVQDGKSHGLVMFIDWSGSMAVHLENTVKQLLALTMFCKKVNIPFDVYSFTDNRIGTGKYTKPIPGDMAFMGDFGLINILSSRMSAIEFTKAATFLVCISGKKGGRYYNPRFIRLGGTPLNETIVAAFDIVPKFKEKYKLQIVNTVFLTDGEGHQTRHKWERNVETGAIEYVYGHGSQTCDVVCDPVTKAQEKCEKYNRLYNPQTPALLQLLKARTGTNVIGFYVLFGREFSRCAGYWPSATNFEALKLEFRKNKYAISNVAGYDSYYFLRSESLDTDDEDKGIVVKSESARTKSLVSAFKKYTEGRVTNRVVLNKFIGQIT
jgi:hypothetical protein